MKKITLTKQTVQQLQTIIKTEPKYRPRKRAEAILLSNKGKTINEIVEILDVKQRAVYSWFKNYEINGITGLYDKEGKGRKTLFRNIDIQDIKDIALHSPSVSFVRSKIKEKFNVSSSKETIRTFLKKNRIELYES